MSKIYTANSFIVTGGTNAQFLKGDGTLDSSVYYLASNPSGYITGTNVAYKNINNNFTSSQNITGFLDVSTELRIGGININSANTLSNVAYRNQNNNFLVGQTVAGTITAKDKFIINAADFGYAKFETVTGNVGVHIDDEDGIFYYANDKLQINGTTGASSLSGNLSASSFIKAGGLSTQYLMADGSVSLQSDIPVKSSPTFAISGATTLTSAHNNGVLYLNASATITIPLGLPTDFEWNVITKAGFTLTYVLASGVTALNNTGLTMAEKLMMTGKKIGTTEVYFLIGI